MSGWIWLVIGIGAYFLGILAFNLHYELTCVYPVMFSDFIEIAISIIWPFYYGDDYDHGVFAIGVGVLLASIVAALYGFMHHLAWLGIIVIPCTLIVYVVILAATFALWFTGEGDGPDIPL